MKERLDKLLVSLNYFDTRERAKKAIMAGLVQVNDQVKDKAGDLVDTEATILVKGSDMPYVSRGGLKLEKGLAVFEMPVAGKTFIDIGSSTGGFTDCLLQNGAEKVYAVDVGYGQLDWTLRNDPRVVNMEKVNIRYLEREKIAESPDFISIDVSFISLRLVFPVAAELLSEEGNLVCLVKPQFEAGREQVGKKGIIRDKKVHAEVIENVIKYAAVNGLYPQGLDFSPMTGAKGNIEYLLHLNKRNTETDYQPIIDAVVNTSHEQLDN